jgi:hypothetical protein
LNTNQTKECAGARFPAVYSLELSPCGFWFFACAKTPLKNQLITDEGDLKHKLTDLWKHVRRSVLQLVFFEWMEGGDRRYSEKLGWRCDNNSKGQEEPSPITGQTKGEQIISPNPAELTRELPGH